MRAKSEGGAHISKENQVKELWTLTVYFAIPKYNIFLSWYVGYH